MKKNTKWYCNEFNKRISVKLIKNKETNMFMLHSFAVEHKTTGFNYEDCAFIETDGKAFFPEVDRNFVTRDCVWYIKPPKTFYIYFNRKLHIY
ncbi:hypothetical protein KAU51_04850 [Candidatus Parcubacteria bacterium]|nr:hypothetical protein [Candidatus Parcubacteria bacterium]